MAWRVLLSERPIRRLDLLPGKPALVAAWTTISAGEAEGGGRERAAFLDMTSGAKVDERTLDLPSGDLTTAANWRAHLLTLTAPNKDCLPRVRTPRGTLLSARDGKARLLIISNTELRHFGADGQETKLTLEVSSPVAALEFDPVGGVIAALERVGKLHVYRGPVRIGIYDVPLTAHDDLQPAIALPEAVGIIYLLDGRKVIAVEPNGTIHASLELFYPAGALACSPDGKLIAVTDLESHVIRVYNSQLALTHQRFAVDLLADAKRAQLLGSASLSGTAVGTIAISSKGALAFSVGGTVCMTNTGRMKALPLPLRTASSN